MNRTAKITTAASAAAIVGLLALATPVVVPFLPQRVQVALGGTIHTVPGTVDDLLEKTGWTQDSHAMTTHAHVDHEYVIAATIWPWNLPPGWGFPESRGVADTPGSHSVGMGLKAAFSYWATASLEAVKAGDLAPDAATDLLDTVEDAYRTLFDAGVLSDRRFIETSITPLRTGAAAAAVQTAEPWPDNGPELYQEAAAAMPIPLPGGYA